MKKHEAEDIIKKFESHYRYESVSSYDTRYIAGAILVVARILTGILGAIIQQSKIIVKRS